MSAPRAWTTTAKTDPSRGLFSGLARPHIRSCAPGRPPSSQSSCVNPSGHAGVEAGLDRSAAACAERNASPWCRRTLCFWGLRELRDLKRCWGTGLGSAPCKCRVIWRVSVSTSNCACGRSARSCNHRKARNWPRSAEDGSPLQRKPRTPCGPTRQSCQALSKNPSGEASCSAAVASTLPARTSSSITSEPRSSLLPWNVGMLNVASRSAATHRCWTMAPNLQIQVAGLTRARPELPNRTVCNYSSCFELTLSGGRAAWQHRRGLLPGAWNQRWPSTTPRSTVKTGRRGRRKPASTARPEPAAPAPAAAGSASKSASRPPQVTFQEKIGAVASSLAWAAIGSSCCEKTQPPCTRGRAGSCAAGRPVAHRAPAL